MKFISYLIFIFLALLPALLFGQVELKSIKVYAGNDQKSFPIIYQSSTLGSSSKITIEFDVDAKFEPDLKILFKFCDKNWVPYDRFELENPGYNTDFAMNYKLLPSTVVGARYHFRSSYPNKNITFPFSGKWRFYIVDKFNEDEIYGEGRFFVARPEVNVNAEITQDRLDEELFPALLNKVFRISIDVDLQGLPPSRLENVEIIENRKLSVPILINKDEYDNYIYYEWNGSNKHSFVVRNIQPGNEYRTTDIRDHRRFTRPLAKAQWDGVEVSSLFKQRYNDNNGASYLIDYKNEYAEYLDVEFRLRLPDNQQEGIYLVGAFTDWEVLPEFEMKNNNGLFAKTVNLKRGYYDYQYVTAENINGKIKNIDWIELEGNFIDTDNEYHIFVYYDTPEKGGYDQIIGYVRISSGELR